MLIDLHKGMVEAWRKAKGRYNLNMSEAANHGQGATARKKHWACAMGGAYAMALGWSFENDAPPVDVGGEVGVWIHKLASN